MSCNSLFFIFKQKTAYEMRISDWSSDVCSSDLEARLLAAGAADGVDRRIVPFQQRVANDDRALGAVLPGQRPGRLRQLRRTHVVCRRVDEVAHQGDGSGGVGHPALVRPILPHPTGELARGFLVAGVALYRNSAS